MASLIGLVLGFPLGVYIIHKTGVEPNNNRGLILGVGIIMITVFGCEILAEQLTITV